MKMNQVVYVVIDHKVEKVLGVFNAYSEAVKVSQDFAVEGYTNYDISITPVLVDTVNWVTNSRKYYLTEEQVLQATWKEVDLAAPIDDYDEDDEDDDEYDDDEDEDEDEDDDEDDWDDDDEDDEYDDEDEDDDEEENDDNYIYVIAGMLARALESKNWDTNSAEDMVRLVHTVRRYKEEVLGE